MVDSTATVGGSPSPPLPPTIDCTKQVLVTRDAKRFLKRASPIAPLATAFFAALSARTGAGQALRSTYYHAVSPSASAVNLEAADATILRALEHPPSIALVQGMMKTSRLLDSESPESDAKSFMSAQSISTFAAYNLGPTPELTDSILLPFVLHQNLDMAIVDRDKEAKAKFAYFALVSICYETAHWLARSYRGFMPYDQLINAARPEFSLQPDDAGTIAITQLFGYHISLITWADGSSELVSVHLDTLAGKASSVQPRLPADQLKQLIGGPTPLIRDGTDLGPLRVGSTPSWSGRDTLGTLVGYTLPAASCHHGKCSRVPHS